MNVIIVFNNIFNFYTENFVHTGMLEQKSKRERNLLNALVTPKIISRIIVTSLKTENNVKKKK